MTGAALDTSTAQRICETPDCGSVLSRFNSRRVCASCEARLEIGGATIPLPKQPAFPSRPPAPTHPTTEGGIPLPGVVKGRERSYEEMIAKPAGKTPGPTPGPACAECGAPLPKRHEGSLCRLCAVAANPPAEPAEKPSQKRTEAMRTSTQGGQGAMQRLPADVLQKIRTPTTSPHGGHQRKFDWDDAARRFQAGATYEQIADQFGVTGRAVTRVVARILTTDQIAAAIAARPPAPKRIMPRGRRRAFDHDEAIRRFREGDNYSAIGRHLGVTAKSIRVVVKRHLEPTEIAAIRERFPLPIRGTSASAPSIEDEKPEAHDPTPVAPPAEDPTPRPPQLDPHVLERAGHEQRIEQIKLLLDANTHERARLNGQARDLLEEWGDINWRLSKLSDEAAA